MNPQSIKTVTMTVIMTVTMTVIMTVMCINSLNEPPLVSFSSVKRMMKSIGTPRVSNQDVGSNMRDTS
jgi:hypothetical protein